MRNLYLTYQRRCHGWYTMISKLLVLTITLGLGTHVTSFASNQGSPEIILELKEASIKDALKAIEKQSRYNFVVNDNRIETVRKSITISIKGTDIRMILDQILEGTNITYRIKKNNITLIPPSDSNASGFAPLADVDRTYFEASVGGPQLNNLFYARPAIVITGKVTDEANAPLPGVNVLVKGTTIGTVTDASGVYSLDVPSNDATLVFSFIGYITQEVPVGAQQQVDVILKADVKTLNEVVVIGYGTQKKSDLTGSVGTVKEQEITERQLPSVSQALAGRVAGVSVNINSGRPGGQSNVRIRGFSSISTSNNPLYVVDGVIMPQGTQTDGTTTRGSYSLNNAIDNINPADIASIEILKDASATAIYGARGANGVILITTKRGSTTGGRITYDMSLSVPTIGPKRVEMLNAREFLAVEQLGWDNIKVYDPAGWNPITNTHVSNRRNPALDRAEDRGEYALFDENGNPLYDTDWLKESTQNKLSQNHQLSLTGGNADNSYGVFLGFRDDNGLLLNSYLTRYSGRFVMDSKIKDWLKVGGSLGYNTQEENLVDHGTGGLNSVRMITEALPILPVRYPNGVYSHNKNYSPSIEGGQNPVDQLLHNKFILRSRTTLGSFYANFNLAKGLELRSTVGTNILEREQDQYTARPAPQTPTYEFPDNEKGSARLQNNRETFWSFENYLTYNKDFNDIHSLTAMAGISWQETNIFWYQARSQTFISDFINTNNLGSASNFLPSPPVESGRSRFAFNSYFGRVNYNLMQKYLLTVTGRMDGSSKFGESNKYAFFPSAALAWRISEEPFLKGNNVISNLKLRSSYGITGNSEIGTYSALPSLRIVTGVANNVKVPAVAINRLGNPDLQWEKTAQTDVGLEIGLFENRINLEADVYYRKTTDMLLDAPLPHSSGYATIVRNVGSMENKGFEFSITSENIQRDNFNWTTTFNIAMNRNKVLKLATPAPIFGVGNPNFTNQTGVIMEGQPVGAFWGLVRLGTWGTEEADEAAKYGQNTYRGTGKPILPGDVKYLDRNDDYQINDQDRMIIGNGNPKSYGSLINTIRYRAFDFTLDLQYSYGNDVLNMTYHSGEDRTGLANSFRSVLNAWTPENQNTNIAAIRDSKAGYVSNVDTHWVEDGSFIRGRNIVLGYTLPGAITERIALSRLRVYVSAQNFFLATKFKGNDPEVSTYTNPFAQGQTFFDYPKPTIYMFGINAGL